MDDRQRDSQATNAQETKGDDHTLAVELAYRFMYDLVVKMVFSKNPELLKNLVAKLLKINPASISKFLVTNVEIVPENLVEKFCRLDIAMEVDGRKVTLEVQIKNEKDYRVIPENNHPSLSLKTPPTQSRHRSVWGVIFWDSHRSFNLLSCSGVLVSP